ncbi:YcxB family protein [Desulfosporosinus sp. PR]|uniref:YcxB family protein n=1 Tax=Candidatus Desulfosporosinus nitrosoreducens TaxID=3401928 RepID=UPI0027E9CF61|nr:YcxB family protein [Desulfosporosinus sp. PR]MDQ7096501.1 YcxB family protein [Desulfosporosinus sp. PR]
MNLEFNISNQDYLEFNLFHLDNSVQLRKSLLISRFFLATMVIGVAFLAMRGQARPVGYIYFTVLLVLVMTFFKRGFKAVVRKKMEKMIEDGKTIGFVGNCELTLTEEGITANTENNSLKTTWGGVERIAENRDYMFIYVGAAAAYIIPVRAFSDSRQKEEFKSIIDTKLKNVERSS